MEDNKKLAVLIVNHLKSQLNSSGFSEEALESLEISVQCIESAYNINSTECDNINFNLEEIVKTYLKDTEVKVKSKTRPKFLSAEDKDELREVRRKQITDNLKEEELKKLKEEEHNKKRKKPKVNSLEKAEYHKNCGNEFMKNQNNDKAVEAYSKSISLDSTNPIYYCNRAAAYNALGKYYDAIDDCQKAIQLKPTYSKAYGRLGFAFSQLKDFHKASKSYKKACDLEPDNVGYRNNLQLAVISLLSRSGSESQLPNETSNLMETAARLTSNPEVASLFNNFVDDVVASSSFDEIERLMRIGQTIAEQFQNACPEFVTELQMQFQNDQNGDQQMPPNPCNHDDNAYP